MSTENTTTDTTTVATAEVKQKGRPVVAGSARQVRLAARAERAANGGSISRGRPVNPTSARAIKLAAKAARLASGEVIKPGRPKVEKVSTSEVTDEQIDIL